MPDHRLSLEYRARAARFRAVYSQRTALRALQWNCGAAARVRGLRAMFGPALMLRIVRRWRATSVRLRAERIKIAALRRKLLQQSALWAWRRLPRVQGVEQGVISVVSALLDVAEAGRATAIAAEHDRGRTLRKYLRRWSHAKDVRHSWLCRTFEHWMLLPGIQGLERASAVRIQKCWRMRTARKSMHKLYRLHQLQKFKLEQAAREEASRANTARLLLGGLASRWRLKRAANLADVAKLARLQQLRDDQKERELLREVLRKDHYTKRAAKAAEDALLKKVKRIQAWYRGVKERRGPIRQAIVQARLVAARERRAAKTILFMFRLRKRRRGEYARKMQRAWLGYKGRRAARLRRRAARYNAAYAAVARVSNKVALALGFHGYNARIGWLEVLELVGLLHSDGEAAVENALHREQREYWERVKNREWTLKWQSQANREHHLWMEQHVWNPVRARACTRAHGGCVCLCVRAIACIHNAAAAVCSCSSGSGRRNSCGIVA